MIYAPCTMVVRPIPSTLYFLALDANLTLRLQSDEQRLTSKWTPLLRGGLSYNVLVAGFQELNFFHLEDLKRNDDFQTNILTLILDFI